MKNLAVALLSVAAASAAAVPEANPIPSDVGADSDAALAARMPCYIGGKTWGDNRADALDRVERWCSGNGGSGHYAPHSQRRGCYNALHGDNHYIFRIWNNSGRSNYSSSEDCEHIVQEHILNCNNGGWGNPLDHWESTADVNEGSC